MLIWHLDDDDDGVGKTHAFRMVCTLNYVEGGEDERVDVESGRRAVYRDRLRDTVGIVSIRNRGSRATVRSGQVL
jgi:hypothetical protein